MKKLSLMLLLQCFAVFAFGQYSLKGVVKGQGEPLPGASILLDNTLSGVSAGNDGSFVFRNLKKGDYVLKVSFIGFETRKVSVKLSGDTEIEVDLKVSPVLTEEVLIPATRAKDKTPVAYSNVSADEIVSRNMGQDIPYLLQLTPSFVATSDAGGGVGYTNFRIRGTDMNRINVSIDGIPLTEAESHGTWFVDLPDLASSLQNVQVQRGVGTSTNGVAAFGASIGLQTNGLNKDAYASYKTAYGSFNTFKNTVAAGTGLMNGKFTVDARLSKISSDGFIDRATSDLKSFFISGGYYGENTILKLNVFSGFEETYQAWNGVPSVRLNNDSEGMQLYADHGFYTQQQADEMMASNSRTYNLYTYENQVDHYQQDHYRLFFSQRLSPEFDINIALHYTYGRGYYENFEYNSDYAGYRMNYPIVGGVVIKETDLVNRKWIDNDFYGMTFSANYHKGKSEIILGEAWNTYDGRHFGKVVWARYLGNNDYNHDWYEGTGLKKDFSMYLKYNFQATEKLNLFADMQYRYIDYDITGIDKKLRNITQSHRHNFFNPKMGIYYLPSANQSVYFSYARGNREPNRDNYTDADPSRPAPVHETLNDFEMGYNFKSALFSAGANLYYMKYKNQLVLTGKINDVGASVMENVDDSYRKGIEISAGIQPSRILRWDVNVTFSRNKIKEFVEYVDNWDTGEQDGFYIGSTGLSFSPQTIANSIFSLNPAKNLGVSFVSTYVGKQFIDNTSDESRSLDAYFVNNLKIDYTFKTKLFSEIRLHLAVNNIFDEEYESNAWVYSYLYGGVRYKMDGYFPQAGTNFMVGADFSF